ncbi:MAG: bifunctional diaminohydroxyphosphoribosylaminopyrimidine deaminase/5-amino-6-(5-phosphoribosylamino)uracil reductase RibD [Akkermansia sp.]
MSFSEQDQYWMQQALKEARRGIGLTAPNPPVGAVLSVGDQMIGIGFHHAAGRPHAEREAFADALAKGNESLLSKATLYVTLEPCSSFGKTPPCSDAIREYQVARVVYGSTDPDARHAGRALGLLNESGIPTESGLMEDECDDLIKAFRKTIQTGLPWVIVKTASSLDGRIARQQDKSQWITSHNSRHFVHTLRAEADGILTGGQTIRTDNPALTIREANRPISPEKKQPWRVILTHHHDSIPLSCICLTDQWKEKTLVIENEGECRDVLHRLYSEYGISTLLVEAGGNLVSSLLKEKLVDEWIGFYAPMILGGSPLSVEGQDFLTHEVHLEQVTCTPYSPDFCIRGLLRYE